MRKAMFVRHALLRAACVVALCAALAGLAAAQELTVRGRLGRTVEAGGWLIVGGKQKYLVINARQWVGEAWFREGAEVEATGTVRKDVVTTQMEGVPFEARSLRPTEAAADDGAARQSKAGGATTVVVAGDATVHTKPDTANITVAVVTQGQTALAAQQENARKTDAVVRAVKAAMGEGAEVSTSGYSLQPQYVYRQNESPVIQGYQARNSVTVTLPDLARVGPVIDAATGAGANNVDGLSFTLRNDRAASDEALSTATREAVRKAQVIAAALGGRVTRVVEVEESGTRPRPVPVAVDRLEMRTAVAGAVPTPVEIGTLDVHAQVQIVAEISYQQ